MATIDPQVLLKLASCYQCNSGNPYELTLIELALLRQIALAQNPMADTSPQTLLNDARCYKCFGANVYMLTLMKLALLQQVVAGSVVVPTGQVLFYTTTDPNTEGLVPGDLLAPAVAYKEDGTGAVFGWDVANQIWH